VSLCHGRHEITPCGCGFIKGGLREILSKRYYFTPLLLIVHKFLSVTDVKLNEICEFSGITKYLFSSSPSTINSLFNGIGTRFAHFGSRSCDGKEVMDFIISTNIAADDVNHPVNVQNVVVEDTVDFNNIAFFHSPNVG